MSGEPEVVGSEVIFEGRVFAVHRDRLRLPGRREVRLEIVRHPPSVVLLPMPDAGRVVLVRQYRHAVARWLWELPAGSVDAGETLEAAARRECQEEVGLAPGRVELLGVFYPTPGFCDEQMTFFRATDLRPLDAPPAVDEDELLEPRVFAVAEAHALLARGEIADMKTALGLSLFLPPGR